MDVGSYFINHMTKNMVIMTQGLTFKSVAFNLRAFLVEKIPAQVNIFELRK